MSESMDIPGTYRWAKLSYNQISGRGKLQPAVMLSFDVRRIHPGVELEVISFDLKLTLNSEVLARGNIGSHVGMMLYDDETVVTFEAFSSREALLWATELMTEHVLRLTAEFTGLLRARRVPGSQSVDTNFLGDDWQFFPIQNQLAIPIARSDWIKLVLEPTGYGDYLLIETRVPKQPQHAGWAKAFEQLAKANEQFINGNDPAVFLHCRAIFEGLPGAPKTILDKLLDQRKREEVNSLLLKANSFFHSGRHVTNDGPLQGDFPVDHRDAEFALSLATIFLAYLSKILTEG